MSGLIGLALAEYKGGRYEAALSRLTPILASRADHQAALIAAQCHFKLGNKAGAADCYMSAAEAGAPNAAMLRALAAELFHEINGSQASLGMARKAAKSAYFDRVAETVFRGRIHAECCFNEALMEDQRFLDQLRRGNEAILGFEQPLDHISWCADEAINARMTYLHNTQPFTAASRANRRAAPHDFATKIRVGYLSADFSDQHATMRLLRGVLTGHDRAAFDITCFCNSSDEMIATDRGLRAELGNIVPIRGLNDEAVCRLIRNRQIDILVDLKGHTKDGRPGVLNAGAAPIQVAFLGFPGSGTGIDCDYVIGDRFVLPEESKRYYHEKFCRLPDAYQPNDRATRPLPTRMSRTALGLPEQGIVFAAFNLSRKISHQTATLWQRILDQVPGSVLWLLADDPFAVENLKAWMRDEGLAAGRIMTAPRLDYAAHIARLSAADIGLDTFPYNGHTTTSDTLWAGTPVPTWRGSHFASRVSESLLNAIGLVELVADGPDAYVALCVTLAKDHGRLARLKDHLATQRMVAPLFDTVRFTHHLESAYKMMVERARSGLAPDHFDVPALDDTANCQNQQ